VTDSGFGMDEQTLKRAMEPFFTTKGIGKGTGLGLPMAYGMAEQSGGKLVLKSKPGHGTTAELCLPVAPADMVSTPEEIAPRAAAPIKRKLAVLTVDDDPLVALNTCALLEELGHKVYSASSGTRALEILRQEKDIDLLITDQAMPGMTGSELAIEARAERPALPVILATGYAELPPGEGERLSRLAKPFRQQDLAEAIDEALSD
jgi:CheY-like chemotaxis protein